MNVFVIGGGPAGMMAAIDARTAGADVVLIEKNEKLGKKLYITGKGRCNLTNASSDAVFFQNIISNPKFLYTALKEFNSAETMRFFEENGLPLKVERGERVFPVSDKSSDVIKVLSAKLTQLRVSVHLNEKVLDVTTKDGKIHTIITNKTIYYPDKVILATGGISYPATGSTGEMFSVVEKLGHSLIPMRPSLVGIRLKGMFDNYHRMRTLSSIAKLQGISLKNVNASVLNKDSGKILHQEFGEMLFTEEGVSGPIVLTLSAKINRLDIKNLMFSIDLKPALTEKMLDDRMIKIWQEEHNKFFKNSLSSLLPSGLIAVFVAISGIDPDKPVNLITREERKNIVTLLKNWTFLMDTLEPVERAVVTAGGVHVKEIMPKTMRSKLYQNLYFAGEMMDIDALTGGYNIQLAFTTGHSAGAHIMEE